LLQLGGRDGTGLSVWTEVAAAFFEESDDALFASQQHRLTCLRDIRLGPLSEPALDVDLLKL